MTDRDPIRALADALSDVIRVAVADALAAAEPHSSDATAMVDVTEAARRLSLGQTTVKRLVASDQIGSVVVGRRRLIPVAALAAYAAGLQEAT